MLEVERGERELVREERLLEVERRERGVMETLTAAAAAAAAGCQMSVFAVVAEGGTRLFSVGFCFS